MLVLGPKILSHALRLMHAGILVIQVLSVLNILLSVGVRIRIVRLLCSGKRLVIGRLPSVAGQVRTARHTAVLRSIGSWRLEGVG